jgi:Domain of unknown function (DUF3943)
MRALLGSVATWLRPLALLAALVHALPARAEPSASLDDDDEHVHGAVAAGWAVAILIPPTAYYWGTTSLQRVDWTLGWDWKSWGSKLFSFDHIKWDTNSFTGNAIRHPLTGLYDYQIGRSNGFGPLGSELLAFGASWLWEYVIEYPEDPSLNDLIMNPAGAIAIGEPLYQLGQIWRGGDPTFADRARTLLLSPFDAVQDLWRRHPRPRPRVWREFVLALGGDRRVVNDGTGRDELVVSADLDVIAHPDVLRDGPRSSSTALGAWSRVAARFGLGSPSDEKEVATVWFHSRTSLGGHYGQDAAGEGTFLGVGAAFTYRRDRLADEWDRVAFAHLVGPQLQFARGPLRWDAAAYVDFAMIEAHVFQPVSNMPWPPPPYSTVQAAGYYDGYGATISTRLRADLGAWRGDLEVFAHAVRQIDCCDRTDGEATATAAASRLAATLPPVPHGIADERAYWRAALGFWPSRWGIAIELAGAYRRGAWRDLERETVEERAGLELRFDY